MKDLKKNVIAGEINAKYDEGTDILEIFDVNPGLKERIEKTKGLYRNIIEANKNLFINLRDRKIDEMNAGSFGKYSKEEIDLLNARKVKESIEEEYGGGMDMEMPIDLEMDGMDMDD